MVFAPNDQRRVSHLRSPAGAAPAVKGGSCQVLIEQGEAYRLMLYARIRALGVAGLVTFDDSAEPGAGSAVTGRYPASTSEHLLRLGDDTGLLEPQQAYANARVPHAMIAAGQHLERPSVLSEGVRLLPREGPHDR